MDSKDKVSILIPCYNAQQWISGAIQSALDQTWKNKEVIVVDDGSTDGSLDVIKSFGDCIRWESGPNRGGNAARNRLLELAKGEWLQYLDADDYLMPSKVERDLETLLEDPDADIIFSPVTVEQYLENRRDVHPISVPHDPWVLLALWELPQTGCVLWKKEAILDVGGWKNDQPCCQEHELYLRLLMAGKRFQYNPYCGAIYRQWSEQTVCRRDPIETRTRRLEILCRAEQFLRDQDEITPRHLRAINQARLETARSSWLDHREFSLATIKKIQASDNDFFPMQRSATPYTYRLVYRWLGFEYAERFASKIRFLKQSPL